MPKVAADGSSSETLVPAAIVSTGYYVYDSFLQDRETEKLFHGRFSSRLPQSIQRAAAMKLAMLHAATLLETLRVPPSNNLEALRGDRAGQYSIRINRQWRICFTWLAGNACEVEIVDYH